MNTAVYISIMAVVTYLIRSVPFMLFKEKLKSHFFIIFFDYIPYAVLGAMTIPWIFDYGKNPICALFALICAVILAFFNRPLITVAILSCAAAFAAGLVF